MAYLGLSGLIIVLALIFVLVSAKLLIGRGWLLGWLRGMLGLVLLAASVVFGLSALDFYSYKQMDKDASIANVSFTRLASQQFKVSLVDSAGTEAIYELSGDLWQLDARVLKWSKAMRSLGLTPGYRLDRLSGRYVALEEERNAPRTVYELSNSRSVLDVWQWLRDFGSDSLISASYGSATYLPMADGALFSVRLSQTGLAAYPLNDRAKSAVEGWE